MPKSKKVLSPTPPPPPPKTPNRKYKVSPEGAVTHYTPEFGKWICDVIAVKAAGYRTLRKTFPQLPTYDTIQKWRHKHKEFADEYLRAKEAQAELALDEMDDWMPAEIGYFTDKDGNQRIDAPSASLIIAKANNRKWMASKLLPKKYGDARALEDAESKNKELESEIAALKARLAKENKKEY